MHIPCVVYTLISLSTIKLKYSHRLAFPFSFGILIRFPFVFLCLSSSMIDTDLLTLTFPAEPLHGNNNKQRDVCVMCVSLYIAWLTADEEVCVCDIDLVSASARSIDLRELKKTALNKREKTCNPPKLSHNYVFKNKAWPLSSLRSDLGFCRT